MTNFGKLALSLLALPSFLLASSTAFAITTPPECGNFDFNKTGIDCKIRVSAECSLDCSSLNFQAGCSGGCMGEPIPGCTDPCGDTCLKECNPDKLDCIAGCHIECEQPFIDKCTTDHAGRDCVTDAKASCTGYCRDACAVMPSGCEDHCLTCCSGSCTSYENMSCDISCYAKLEGSCKAQCSTPDGALMCKDVDGRYQFVNATSVQSCVSALVAQGLKIDVSARGECTCTLAGCDCGGGAQAGGLACAAAPSNDSPFAPIAIAMGMAAAGISVARRRNRKNG
jgi:hypothetical protein